MQLLQAGCNDLGGTLMDENISRAAGASHGQEMTADDFRAMVEPLGRTLQQRTTLYGPVHVRPRRRRLTPGPVAYHLGVDVGTTYTAAAVGPRRRAEAATPRHPQRWRCRRSST